MLGLTPVLLMTNCFINGYKVMDGAWWLITIACFPPPRAGNLNPTSALCVWSLHFLCVSGVSSRFNFFPKSKAVHGRLTSISKLSICVNESVCDYIGTLCRIGSTKIEGYTYDFSIYKRKATKNYYIHKDIYHIIISRYFNLSTHAL